VHTKPCTSLPQLPFQYFCRSLQSPVEITKRSHSAGYNPRKLRIPCGVNLWGQHTRTALHGVTDLFVSYRHYIGLRFLALLLKRNAKPSAYVFLKQDVAAYVLEVVKQKIFYDQCVTLRGFSVPRCYYSSTHNRRNDNCVHGLFFSGYSSQTSKIPGSRG
jgi:hypothetical protein